MRTQEQIDNTEKLLHGLRALPADYAYLHMNTFAENEDDAIMGDVGHGCDSAACVVGHGPSFGIEIDARFITENSFDEDMLIVYWREYAVEAFGFKATGANMLFDKGSDWAFCFSGEWPDSVPEAIARLELAQTGNIPEDWSLSDRFVK